MPFHTFLIRVERDPVKVEIVPSFAFYNSMASSPILYVRYKTPGETYYVGSAHDKHRIFSGFHTVTTAAAAGVPYSKYLFRDNGLFVEHYVDVFILGAAFVGKSKIPHGLRATLENYILKICGRDKFPFNLSNPGHKAFSSLIKLAGDEIIEDLVSRNIL